MLKNAKIRNAQQIARGAFKGVFAEGRSGVKHVLETLAFQSQPKVSYNFLAERLISENLGIFVIKIIISIRFEVRTFLKW